MSVRRRRDRPDAIRVEEWESDGSRTLLVVAARGRNALACGLRVGKGGIAWEHAEAWFPRAAIEAPRDAIAAVLPFSPAGPREAERFLGRGGMGLAGRLTLATPAFAPDLAAAIPRTGGLLPPYDLPEGWAPLPGRGCLAALGPGLDGPEDRTPPRLPTPTRRRGAETPPLELSVAPGLGAGLAGLHAIALAAEALRPSVDRMWDHAGPDARAILGPGAWTPALHARHADPATSRRRLQALRLHPWAAATVAGDPALAGLVDAGRPFEEALAAKASGWSDRLAEVPLGRAALRRLRGMAPVGDPVDLLRILEAVARRGPAPAFADAGGPARLARADHACCLFLNGLLVRDGGSLLRSLPAAALGEAGADAFEAALSAVRDELWGVADMLGSFAETLGVALVGGPMAAVAGAAARLFSPDLSHRSLAGASRRWHRDHARFMASLPAPPPDTRWPALFEPVDLPGGIRATCLVTPACLSDEGGAGPDRAGVSGLDHCVSGYARRCIDGEAHIVSLRLGPEGPRLSTLELHAGPGWTPRIAQHRGHGNSAPRPVAEAAAEALVDGLASGGIPIVPGASRRPPPPGERGREPTPDEVAAAMAAWAPFLPGRPGDAGVLRDRLSEFGYREPRGETPRVRLSVAAARPG